MIDEKNVKRAIDDDLPPCGKDGVNYPLHEFFLNVTGDRLSVGFDELGEKRVSQDLPPSAYTTRSWWNFQSEHDGDGKIRHRHALAWLNAGWRIESISLESQEVVFVRFKGSKTPPASTIEPEKKNPKSRLVLKSFYSALKGAGQIVRGKKPTSNPIGSIVVVFFGAIIFLSYFFGIKPAFTIVMVLLGVWIANNIFSRIFGKAFIPMLISAFVSVAGVLGLILITTIPGKIILGAISVAVLGFLGLGIGGDTWGAYFGSIWSTAKNFFYSGF